MRIAIDARFYGPEGTGIGRYLENLLVELEKIDQKNYYSIILRKENFHLYNPKNPNFQKVVADARWYSLKEQVLLPAVLAKLKPDLVHFPHVNIPLLWGGKFVVTIHDLTKTEFGGAASSTKALPIYLIKNQAYKITLNQALRRAEKILIPSNFVKEKIATTFGVKKEKLKVTYEAADPKFIELGQKGFSELQVKKTLKTYALKKPYILYVGNLFPYKNAEILLESLPKMNKDISLVLVGSRNRFTDSFQKKVDATKLTGRVRFTGYVPNEELAILYQEAAAFVFPSLSEGFGLPGIEAMASNCPVIAAKASSLPEIYGDAAAYFDPNKSAELAGQVELLTSNSKLRNELIEKGTEQVEKYSWKKLARETLSVYQEVV